MFNINALINDEVIDKRRLLLKNYFYLGINDQELLLLLKVLDFVRTDEVTLSQVRKKLNDEQNKEFDRILASLINRKLLSTYFKKTSKEVFLDFSELWGKLLNIYIIPEEESSFEQKLNWFLSIMQFEANPLISERLIYLIENDGWKRVVEVINKIKENKFLNISWNAFNNLYSQLNADKKLNRKKINQLIELNWLED